MDEDEVGHHEETYSQNAEEGFRRDISVEEGSFVDRIADYDYYA